MLMFSENGKAQLQHYLAALAEGQGEYREMSAKELGRSIADLEKQMFKHAELLEFEDAARVRDQIEKLKREQLRSPEIEVFTD